MSAKADLDDALAGYAAYFETLTRASIPAIARLAAPDMRFKDPFNDVRGVEAVGRVMASMFEHGTPRFEVLDRARSGSCGFLLWRMSLTRPRGGAVVIRGVSEVRFDAAGRVTEHVDHWDAAEQFHERLPGVGWMLRRIKRRMAAH